MGVFVLLLSDREITKDYCVWFKADILTTLKSHTSQTSIQRNKINIQYTYIVRKYKIYLYELQKQAEQRAFGELFMPVSQRVQKNYIFNDNVRILCLSCNVKKVGKLVRFKQKGQKQASFLAFHKRCQGCLLRGPHYISTSFILVRTLRCTQLRGTRKVYSQAEKFIRLVRIKQKFIRIAYLYSKCTDCRIKTISL